MPGCDDDARRAAELAARRRLMDVARHASVEGGAAEVLRTALDSADRDSARAMFPDERLMLLFVCAHPAIDQAIRAAWGAISSRPRSSRFTPGVR